MFSKSLVECVEVHFSVKRVNEGRQHYHNGKTLNNITTYSCLYVPERMFPSIGKDPIVTGKAQAAEMITSL